MPDMTELTRIERPNIIVTRKLLPEVEARMAQLFGARFNAHDEAMSPQDMVAAMEGCDVLVPTVTDSIDSALIDAMPDCVKLIANYGAGVNHIDLAAAKRRGMIRLT
jgi:glyoxylate reductase